MPNSAFFITHYVFLSYFRVVPKVKGNFSLAFLDREEPNREKPKKRKSLVISESYVFWRSFKLILPSAYNFISMSSHPNYHTILFVNHHPTYWP